MKTRASSKTGVDHSSKPYRAAMRRAFHHTLMAALLLADEVARAADGLQGGGDIGGD